MVYQAKNIRKKQLIGRKMLWIIKYLGRLALRPTASSSPENSHFSQKLLSSCAEAVLEHRMFLLLYTGKKREVEGLQFFQIFRNSQFLAICLLGEIANWHVCAENVMH